MSKLSRRRLLKLGAAGAAGAMAAPYFIPTGVLAADGKPGANERVAVGAIGVGGRATLLLQQLPEDGQLIALCDCNVPRAEKFKADHKGNWPIYQNYHKILERKDIDAVVIATQEWQRVTPSIHACQAGKDVYAEKPLTLCVHEGRVLVNVVRKHERVFQVGSQQRSMALNRIACEAVRTGVLGKLLEVLAVCYTGNGPSTTNVGRAEPTPAGLDWNMWLNQAAWRPFNKSWGGGGRDFSGGEMTNWGAHGVDQIQWATGMDGTGPVEMWPTSPGNNGKVAMRYANGVPINFSLDPVRRAAPFSSARRASSRSTATSSRRTRKRSPRSCSKRSTRRMKRRSGAIRRPSGRRGGTCRTGSTAFARGKSPRPTLRSAIDQSASAIWRTSPAGSDSV